MVFLRICPVYAAKLARFQPELQNKTGARPPPGAVFRALAESSDAQSALKGAWGQRAIGWSRGRGQRRPRRAWSPNADFGFSRGETAASRRLRCRAGAVARGHSCGARHVSDAASFKCVMRKTAPRGSLPRHSISQPCARMICCTTARPRPVPFWCVVK